MADNATDQRDDHANPARIRIDLRPDTCTRTSSPSYKPSQILTAS